MPFRRWKVFLHPAQRKAVTANSKGPIRVTGGAGTGKTVVGLHRAGFLQQIGYEQVNVLTFNRALSENLQRLIRELYPDSKQIQAKTFHAYVAQAISDAKYPRQVRHVEPKEFLGPAISQVKLKELAGSWDDAITHFIYKEITEIIAAQRISTEAAYLRARRPKRAKLLGVPGKRELWKVYQLCWQYAAESCAVPYELWSHLAMHLGVAPKVHEALIVDEVQDLSACDLAFLAEKAPGPNQLTLLEDMKQRIYGRGYSLKQLGINVVGRRSIHLFVNYRSTAQIAAIATEALKDTGVSQLELPRSVRKGKPVVDQQFDDGAKECQWLIQKIEEIQAGEGRRVAIIARHRKDLETVQSALFKAGIDSRILTRDEPEAADGQVALCTMHSAKGMEFEVVFMLDVKSSAKRRGKKVEDDFERQDSLRREQHLLYVALSRARDELYISRCPKR